MNESVENNLDSPEVAFDEATEWDIGDIRILLIEDNVADVRLIEEALKETKNRVFELETVSRLSDGMARLARGGIDVVLLDLSLPDSEWSETFSTMQAAHLDVPVVVLSGLDDETVAVNAMHHGAQDYLVKGEVDGRVLQRSLQYAVERHRMLAKLRELSVVDVLTGLHNRRGFMALAEQQLKLARRTRVEMLMFFADLDGLKRINDNFGHRQGDKALRAIARILKQSFRVSDIVGRLGGDEFAVLAAGTGAVNVDAIKARLQGHINSHSAAGEAGWKLSLSVGSAMFALDSSNSVQDLIDRADADMYELKERNREARN